LLNSGTNNKQILGNVISLFIVSHNEVMSNLKLANDILFERVIRSQELPKDIMSNYLNFQKNTTILLPYASYILSRLCDRAKDFKLSNSVLNYSKEKYDILSESLLNSFEKTRENICKGKSTKLIELFSDNQRHLLKSSIENKVNEKLFSTFELPNVS